jgi:hypothetical protein
MTRIAKYILMSCVILLPFRLLAQRSKINYRDRLGDSTVLVNTAVKPPKIKSPPGLTSEFSGGIKINSDGYGIFLDKGWLKGGDNYGQENKDKLFNVRVLEFELIERKDPKEKMSNNAPGIFSFGSNAYILGKINKFYAAKLGYGNRKLIAGKPESGTYSLHWVYLGGVSVALLKPYYLNIYGEGDVKYNDTAFDQRFISPNEIQGRASFFKGFNELKVVPGFYFKTALHLDFSNKRKTLWAMEVGINAEAYTQKIEQMVASDPKSYFVDLYAAFSFGKMH